ncbi:dephospho-CoA kinase domain-containing protein [Aplysia californica]|uniref:Dephospho-CoA kinase domain-containing protein n=1 Tax=Aplysia californica TaxID=6500 RepID=A0ABM0JB70_APLCA|nr:dephospho-CoA kinase domain-containing protein [Aplysia californica]
MFLVGLTGGIASGKSTVAKEFQALGCPCVDADLIARQVVEPGEPAYEKIKGTFGPTVFHENGLLNREKLGQIIFHDASKRQQLNAIVHPAIKKRMLREVLQYLLKGYQFVICDIPLLFETKQMLPFVSYTVVVYCDEDKQLSRLMQRNGLSEEDAQARMKSQLPLSEKCLLCSYVIDNNGDLEGTKQHVKEVFKKMKSSRKHLVLRFGILAFAVCMFGGLYFALR